MRARDLIAATAVVAVGAGLIGVDVPVASAQQPASVVRIVHGVRDLVADVYLDGALALPTFQPERSTEPIEVPAGGHLIELRQAGASERTEPLLSQSVRFPAGFRGTLVAHLGVGGKPRLTLFADDLSVVPAGRSRVVVRHVAQAASVDVLLDERAAAAAIENPHEMNTSVAAGRYRISVNRTGQTAPILAPQAIELAEGSANFMYLIGSAKDGTLGWAAVTVTDLQTPPAQIQTGDGSTPPPASGSTDVAAIVAVIVLMGIGVAFLNRRRLAIR